MYPRKDKSPRMVTPGFEHPNNFVLFGDGSDVFVKRIDNDESLTTNLVQFTKTPLSQDCAHFSMTILELNQGEFVMLGLTNKCVPGHPMWIIDRSVRYHSNDGGVFNGGLGIKTYHPYSTGDVVMCQLDYTGPDRCLVNFLKNGRLVYRQWVNLPPGQLYPTIGVSRTEAKLRVQWPEHGKGVITISKDLPSNWFGWTGLDRDDQTKIVTLSELDTEMEREAYNIQCPVVFNKDFCYFEVEVLARGRNPKEGCLAVGLVSGNCEPFVMPGWSLQSLGYHSDDGVLYSGGIVQAEQKNEHKACKEGDRMGCGVIFPSISESHFREPILVMVYTTKNGELVHKKRTRQPRGGFFPCVGFVEHNDSVKLNVECQAPSSFQDGLLTALNLADVTEDFRCSELIQFMELAPDQAVFTLTTHEDSPQLVQYLRYSLSEVGDGFQLEVLDIDVNTELQLGVSSKDHPMEGSFLGSNSTSCGYLLKLGSLAMKEGMRPVSKWKKGDIITCYLDFIDKKLAILCFEKLSGEMIGRATVSCTDISGPLLASVVMSSGPCTVRLDWSRSIYNTHNLDRDWGEASTWIRPPGILAEKNRLILQADESYSFAACVQCRQPMLTGTSYFSIKLLGGESLAGIGLSRATTDVNNVLGSESGEVCFLPSSGELILDNNKWRLENAPTFKKGDTLQCGMIFAEADRLHQKGAVYFAINNSEFFHCRFLMAHGGVYATVTLSSPDCTAEVQQMSRLQPIPESITTEWLNTDTINGVVTYNMADELGNSGYIENISLDSEEDLPVYETDHHDRVIYISHTIQEKDRINPFINLLRRHYLNFVFKTSSDCVEMAAKQEAVECCELIVIFMSQLYSESHEMALEFLLMKDKSVIVAAHKGMTWPPENYFKSHYMIEKYPRVFVDTVGDSLSVADLLGLMDHILNNQEFQMFEESGEFVGEFNAIQASNGHFYGNGLHNNKSSKNSSACLVL